MSVRKITWAVSADGTALIPATPQWGGVQGEDSASEVRFVIPEDCPLKGMSLYLETVDATGAPDRTDVLFLEENGVSHPVPLAWTQNGGTTTIRLVAENEGVKAYTLEAALYFDNRQTDREGVAGKFKSDIQKMYADMRDMYNRILVMAAEGGFEPGYADHLRNVLTGKPVYIASGSKEELAAAAPYLPEGTIFFGADDDAVERLEKMIGERAPGDCGLGSAVKVDSPDEACKPGFYYCQNVTIDGETFGDLYMVVDATSDGTSYAHQTAHTTGPVSYILHRSKVDGVWQPWEWENPPMKEDVEYRLTERYVGNVLYAQLFTAAVAAGTVKGNLEIGPNSVLVTASAMTNNAIIPIDLATTYNIQLDVRRNGSFTYQAGSSVTDTKLSVLCKYYKKED